MSILKFHRYLPSLPNIIHQGRPETCNASSCVVSDARIHNTGRSRIQEFACKLLRGCVVVWNQAFSKTRTPANVVKLPAEVCQEVRVKEGFFFLPVDLP